MHAKLCFLFIMWAAADWQHYTYDGGVYRKFEPQADNYYSALAQDLGFTVVKGRIMDAPLLIVAGEKSKMVAVPSEVVHAKDDAKIPQPDIIVNKPQHLSARNVVEDTKIVLQHYMARAKPSSIETVSDFPEIIAIDHWSSSQLRAPAISKSKTIQRIPGTPHIILNNNEPDNSVPAETLGDMLERVNQTLTFMTGGQPVPTTVVGTAQYIYKLVRNVSYNFSLLTFFIAMIYSFFYRFYGFIVYMLPAEISLRWKFYRARTALDSQTILDELVERCTISKNIIDLERRKFRSFNFFTNRRTISIPEHPHEYPAVERVHINEEIDAYVSTLGRTRYDVQLSENNRALGIPGSFSYFSVKDLGRLKKEDRITSNCAITFIDVFNYLTDEQLQHYAKTGQPMLIYTFNPLELAGNWDSVSWRLNDKGEFETTVVGGTTYQERVFDFSRDVITIDAPRKGRPLLPNTRYFGDYLHYVFRLALYYLLGPDHPWNITVYRHVYSVETKRGDSDPIHCLTLLNPIRTFRVPSWAPIHSYPLSPIKYKAIETEVEGKKGLWFVHKFMGRSGSYISYTMANGHRALKIPTEYYDAAFDKVKAIANWTMSSLAEVVRPLAEGTSNAHANQIAAALTNIMRSEGHIPATTYSVTYKPDHDRSFFDLGRPALNQLFPPMIMTTNAIPVSGDDSNYDMVVQRILVPQGKVVLDPIVCEWLIPMIIEFVDFHFHDFDLGPLLLLELHESMKTNPNQCKKLMAAMDCGRSLEPGDTVAKFRLFFKKECYEKIAATRAISAPNEPFKFAYSIYTRALAKFVKMEPTRFHWYAFSKTPTETMAQMNCFFNKIPYGKPVYGTDMSKFSGYCGYLRLLDMYLLDMCFPGDNALTKLYESQYSAKSSAYPIDGLYQSFDSGLSHKDGSPDTSLFNTIHNAFISWVMFTRLYPDDDLEMRHRRLGVYGGDDGLNTGCDGNEFVHVAKTLALEAKLETFRPNSPYQFLGRWWNADISIPDPMRHVKKLHLTSAKGDTKVLLVAKAMSILATDVNAPVLSQWAKTVLDQIQLKFAPRRGFTFDSGLNLLSDDQRNMIYAAHRNGAVVTSNFKNGDDPWQFVCAVYPQYEPGLRALEDACKTTYTPAAVDLGNELQVVIGAVTSEGLVGKMPDLSYESHTEENVSVLNAHSPNRHNESLKRKTDQYDEQQLHSSTTPTNEWLPNYTSATKRGGLLSDHWVPRRATENKTSPSVLGEHANDPIANRAPDNVHKEANYLRRGGFSFQGHSKPRGGGHNGPHKSQGFGRGMQRWAPIRRDGFDRPFGKPQANTRDSHWAAKGNPTI